MKDKTLDCVNFEYFSDMLEDIFIKMDCMDDFEDFTCATIVGKYEEIRQILNLIISNYVVEIGDIELCSEDCNGYKDEYDLTIFKDGCEVVVCCCPLKYDDEYLNYGADIVYILGNCNSKVQRYCETDAKFVIIGEDNCNNCRCCDCCKDDLYDNKPTDGTYTYSIYII